MTVTAAGSTKLVSEGPLVSWWPAIVVAPSGVGVKSLNHYLKSPLESITMNTIMTMICVTGSVTLISKTTRATYAGGKETIRYNGSFQHSGNAITATACLQDIKPSI
jgi:hypothetical protein